MDNEREQPIRQAMVVQELIDEHASVSCDIVQIDNHTWAIHGLIAVDGNVILAEFGSPDEARTALEQITASFCRQPHRD
jgi:hypothetical protein